MTRAASLILTLMLFMAMVHNSLLLVQFEVQQDYYATELCEQREIEGNECQGHCQLKAILQGDSQDSPNAPAVPPYQEEVLSFVGGQLNWSSKEFSDSANNSQWKDLPNKNTQKGFMEAIWRPPIV